MSQRRQEARQAKQSQRREASKAAARAAQQRRVTSVTTPERPRAATPPPPIARRQSFWTPRNRWLVIGLIAALIAAALIFWILRSATAALPGEGFPSQGGVHLNSPTDPHPPYNSNPPTSGWHLADIPKPGIYAQNRPPETLGHFMEHGGVWVLYNCPGGCPDDVKTLTDLVNKQIDRNHPTALSPFNTMDARFAVVAWQRLLTLDSVDTKQINNFIDRLNCRYSPEGAAPYCPAQRGKIADAPTSQVSSTVTTAPTSVFSTPAATGTPAAGAPAASGTPAAGAGATPPASVASTAAPSAPAAVPAASAAPSATPPR